MAQAWAPSRMARPPAARVERGQIRIGRGTNRTRRVGHPPKAQSHCILPHSAPTLGASAD
eukprot:8079311-Pyramimonas_sp.AAC.1